MLGGGGGTYGVVYSLIAKAHTDIPTSGTNLTFSSAGMATDTYYAAVAAWHTVLPSIVDAGGMTVWFLTSDAFVLTSLHGPGIPANEAKALLQPFLNTLHDLNVKYNMTGPMDFPSYLDEFTAFAFPIEVGTSQYGGRLIPRSVVEKDNEGLVAAIRNITEDKTTQSSFIGVGLDVKKSSARGTANLNNAVLPAWRDTLIAAVIATYVFFSILVDKDDLLKQAGHETSLLHYQRWSRCKSG